MISAEVVGQRFQAQARPTAQRNRIAGWPIIFVPAALVYLIAGWFLAIVREVYDGDAVSRTAQAAAVVLGRDPHLAAIGFVWNPLPSLVQVPLVLVLRPFGLQIYAGAVQSALFMAGTAALLWCFTGLYDSNSLRRGAFVLLFAANPMILLYAANGMSEAMFFFFLVGMAYAFARWARERRHLSLVGMAVMAAGAFGVRYESLPLAGAGFLAILIVLLADRKRNRHLMEASLLVYLAPVVYAVALWIFFNWTIMGDPFYFQRSIYSNDAQSTVFNSTENHLSGAVGSSLGALRYAAARLLVCFVAYGIVLPAAAVAAWRRHWSILGLAVLTLAIPTFHVYFLYAGDSFGWLRFFMCSIPAAFLLAPPLLAVVRGRWSHRIVAGALLVAFLASNAVGLWAMRDPDLGRQEYLYLGRMADADFPLPSTRSTVEDRAVAAHVQQHLDGQRILLDTVRGYAVWLHADHPEQFVIDSDRDFVEILERPAGQVEYVLVPSPTVGRADRINVRYPELYANGLPWAVLVRDFGGEAGWRIFRIAPPTTP